MKCSNNKKFFGGLLIGSVIGAIIGGICVSKGDHEVVENAKTLVASVTDGLNDYRETIDKKIMEIQNEIN